MPGLDYLWHWCTCILQETVARDLQSSNFPDTGNVGFLYSQLFVKSRYPTILLTDQVIIVTGSNVGLEYEAARNFVRLHAARVILAVRNVAAGHEAKETIEQSTCCQGICEVWEVDLASYDSVQTFSARASQLPRGYRIDALHYSRGTRTQHHR